MPPGSERPRRAGAVGHARGALQGPPTSTPKSGNGWRGIRAGPRIGVRGRLFHFTPTSCSWLNAVEGFFAKLTRRRLKHGVFRSVIDLQAAINRFVAEHNEEEAKPFIWRADPDTIIAARNRGFQALESNH